jgi:hypothetical protein
MRVVVATGCFCLLSSAVYIANDLIDRPRDRMHPRKSRRPIAAGRLSEGAAIALLTGLLSIGVAIGLLFMPRPFVVLSIFYVINSLVYCLYFKHKVILDVIVIAVGFVIRLLAGCAAIDVIASPWLVVCGFCLALVLGFGKRRLEVAVLGGGGDQRSATPCWRPRRRSVFLRTYRTQWLRRRWRTTGRRTWFIHVRWLPTVFFATCSWPRTAVAGTDRPRCS